MKSKNLFIVNTPFHLLTAFILLKGRFENDENYLALIHPHGYEKWKKSSVMLYMISQSCGWKQVFSLGNWLSSRQKSKSYRDQVNEVKDCIGKIGIDTIYLGSDIDVQNQLLVDTLNINQFCRYDDGLYSYYNDDRRRSLLRGLFHRTRIAILKFVSGIDGDLVINTAAAGDSVAGICDFMYKPKLVKRFSPKIHEIGKAIINQAVRDLKNCGYLNPSMSKDTILYLSQPLVEQKKITIDEELTILREILQHLHDSGVLMYKPHPNDSAYKVAYYRENLPEMVIHDSIEPVELSFAYEVHLKAVISYQSTALLFPDKFSPKKIKTISLVKFYKSPIHPAYVEIMSGAGVYIPNNLQDVIRYLNET